MADFGDWHPLTRDDVNAHAPDGPAAVQLSRADRMLIAYPTGKSSMVFYFYAARSAQQALLRLFADELAEPGSRDCGPLQFRTARGGDDVKVMLERLYADFERDFGAPPFLHAEPSE